MTKKELIREILADQEDSYKIFCKGYLNHFPMDEGIFSALLPKLVKEANELMDIANILLVFPEKVSNEISLEFDTKADEFYKLVFNACLGEVVRLPFVSSCSRILANKLNPSFISKLNAKGQEGYAFSQEAKDGSFNIVDSQGLVVYTSPFVSAQTIFQEWGIDIEDPQYALFYFGIFPKEELEQYRTAYCFSKHFHIS